MARVNIAIEFDAEEREISSILDAVHGAVQEVTGEEPMFGLQVDGEHRDPDEPESDLFS